PSASSARTFTAGVIRRFATVVLGCVPNTSWVAAPGVILKPLLVVGVRPVRSEERREGVAGWLRFRSTNVDTPLTAATGVVPLSALPPGLLPSAMVTASVNPAATLPKASSARTFTAGLIWRFATVVLGCVPNTSWVAAPGVILKPLLVVGVRPVAVALSA